MNDGLFPTRDGYWFDLEKALRVVAFIELLPQWKGPLAGQPLKLLPWQHELVCLLFGCVDEAGLRQYRTAFVFVPRKGGKTHTAAAIALALLFIDGEEGAEIYSAAHDRDQAAICFDVAAGMVKRLPELRAASRTIDHTKRILHPATDGFYRAISADAAGSHGFNASAVVFDELHTQRNRDLWDALLTSTAARAQPLVVAITTAGWDRESICWEVYDYATKVQAGVIEDPTFLPVIFEADKDDDWTSEEVWRKANPGLGVTVPLSYFETECEKAREMPAYQNTFRRLLLNQWTEQADRWIDLSVWDRCDGEVDPGTLEDRECYAGLDLSTTTDISAFVMVFPPVAGEPLQVVPFFWIPEDNAHQRSRRDGVPYDAWLRDGWMKSTEGSVVDYDCLRADINELGESFNIREIEVPP
ncbi:terminase large subunit [Gemmatimonadota bacterium]